MNGDTPQPPTVQENIPICLALFCPTPRVANGLSNYSAGSGANYPSLSAPAGAVFTSPALLGEDGTIETVLWNNGAVIPYSFLNGTDKQKKKVKTVLKQWTRYANVTFQPSRDGDAAAFVRITFDSKGADWSYIGKFTPEDRKEPTMALGSISDTNNLAEQERHVILHEFGHVLGLLHEHQSPAANFNWKEKQVLEWYLRIPGVDEDFVKNNILYVYQKEQVLCNSDFDEKSIMGYLILPQFTLEGVKVDVNTVLSEMDKAYMVINYHRPRPHFTALKWTRSHAFKVAGVPAEIWKTWDLKRVREEFQRYQQRAWKIECGKPSFIVAGVRYYEIFSEPTLRNVQETHSSHSVCRQYEDFIALRDDLVKESLHIPTLPAAGLRDKLFPKTFENKLIIWLNLLVNHKEFAGLQKHLCVFLENEKYNT